LSYRKGVGFGFVMADLDSLRYDEVLVKLKTTGIYHTDIAIKLGKLPFSFLAMLGHEDNINHNEDVLLSILSYIVSFMVSAMKFERLLSVAIAYSKIKKKLHFLLYMLCEFQISDA
jgi:hypothetical protein